MAKFGASPDSAMLRFPVVFCSLIVNLVLPHVVKANVRFGSMFLAPCEVWLTKNRGAVNHISWILSLSLPLFTSLSSADHYNVFDMR